MSCGFYQNFIEPVGGGDLTILVGQRDENHWKILSCGRVRIWHPVAELRVTRSPVGMSFVPGVMLLVAPVAALTHGTPEAQ